MHAVQRKLPMGSEGRLSVKRILFLLIVILYADVGFALTIATGPSDGTYIQIARDIQKVAQKDGIKVEIFATQGPSRTWCCWEIGRWILRSPKSIPGVFAKVMKPQGINVFETIRVILNLYPEEIHVLTNNSAINSFLRCRAKGCLSDQKTAAAR